MAGTTHRAHRQAGGVAPQAWVIGVVSLVIGLWAAAPRAGAGILVDWVEREDPFTVVDGAMYTSVEVAGTSTLHVVGGRIQNLNVRDESTTNISGGEVEMIRGGAFDPIVNITGGRVGSIIFPILDGRTPHRTVLTIDGGEVSSVRFAGTAQPVRIRGGHVELLQVLTVAEVVGGSIDRLEARRVRISGGHVGALNIGRVGTVSNLIASAEITGGVIGMLDLSAVLVEAQVLIFGSDFNLPLGPVEPLSGFLTGTLRDGTPLELTFSRGTRGTITLVPEPWSGAVFLLTMPLLLRRSVRGKSRGRHGQRLASACPTASKGTRCG